MAVVVPDHDLRPGSVVYLAYDEEEEPWHERLVVAPGSTPTSWFVATPDDDVYEEEISSPPLRSVKVASVPWKLPSGLGMRYQQPVYRFRFKPSARKVLSYEAEVRRLQDLEAAVSSVPPDRRVEPSVAMVPSPVDDPSMVWIVVSPAALGQEVPARSVVPSQATDEFGVGQSSPGVWAAVQRIPATSKEAFLDSLSAAGAALTPRGPAVRDSTAGGVDARTLAVERNTAGERFRSVQSLADGLQQEDFADWALEGPRTTRWWVGQVSRAGTGIVARHHTWRHENGLPEDNHQTHLHEVLSEALEMLGCVDQLDLSNLAGAEVISRHLQFIEHEVKRKADAKRTPDGSEFFVGRAKRTGGALVAPELLKWVAEQASKESAILKETRKAAEERALARPAKK